MIKGLINEGMPVIPVATDGEIWYTLLTNGTTTAFGSAARDIPPQLTRCVLIPKFLGGNNFDFVRKRVTFPNSPIYDDAFTDYKNITMTPDDVNLPQEGLFAGVSYTPTRDFDCYATTIIPTPNECNSLSEFSFRGVDTNLITKKFLKIIFVPYSTAISKYNEGTCTPVVSRDQFFFDFINGIDNLGNYKGEFRLPKNCSKFSEFSQDCYNIGVNCFAVNYCTTGTFCETGGCYGKVRFPAAGYCGFSSVGVDILRKKKSTDVHTLADDGGVVPNQKINAVKSEKRNNIVIFTTIVLCVISLILFLVFINFSFNRKNHFQKS